MKLMLSILILCFSASSLAQVHRWVDADGRVHFGDSKSAQNVKNKQDISRDVSRVNIDGGAKYTEKVREQRQAEAQADSDLAQLEQQKRAQTRAQYLPVCKRLRQEMQIIESGEPVRFLNDDGSEKIVKDKDRGEQLANWRASYEQLQCDDILGSE